MGDDLVTGRLRHVGSRAAAKWARLASSRGIDVSKMNDLLFNSWGLPKPAALISVVGGETSSELEALSSHDEMELSRALTRVARATNAWLLSSATSDGVGKLVGTALAADAAASDVPLVGVAPWPWVAQTDELARSAELSKEYPYLTHAVADDGRRALASRATHVLLADRQSSNSAFSRVDETDAQATEAHEVRRVVENAVSPPPPAPFTRPSTKPLHHADDGAPMVLVVLGGDVHTLETVVASVEDGRPVVVLPNTGHAAQDIHAVCFGGKCSKALDGERLDYDATLGAAAVGSSFDVDDGKSSTSPTSTDAYRGHLRRIRDAFRARRETAPSHPAVRTFSSSERHAFTDELPAILLAALESFSESAVESASRVARWTDAAAVRLAMDRVVKEDGGGASHALGHALRGRSASAIEAILEHACEPSCVHLDLLAADEDFRSAAAGLDEGLARELLKEGDGKPRTKLAITEHKLDRANPAVCPGSVCGFLMLQTLLQGVEPTYSDELRLRWQCSQASAAGRDGGGEARLTPSWFELMMWSVAVRERRIARSIWKECDEPFRAAVIAARLARSIANRCSGAASRRTAKALRADADAYESWAVGVLESASSAAEAHLLLLATSANLGGTQRSVLELATDTDATSCRALATHPATSESLGLLFAGFRCPGLADGDVGGGQRPSLQTWVDEIEDSIEIERIGPLALYSHPQNGTTFGKALGLLRTLAFAPRARFAVHAFGGVAYFVVLCTSLCSLPFEGLDGRGAIASTSLPPLEVVVWVWTVCLVLEQLKQLRRRGRERYKLEASLSSCFVYLESPSAIRELLGHLLILVGAVLRISELAAASSGGAGTPSSSLLGWVATLYAAGVLLASCAVVGVLHASWRHVGVFVLTLRGFLLAALPWATLVLALLATCGVALTVLLPGLSARASLWDKPALMPLLALLGDFSLADTTLDPPTAPILHDPAGYAPPLLLLLCQAFAFLALLSALIGLASGSQPALAEHAAEEWDYARVHLVSEFLSHRDPLPPPLNVLPLACYDLPRLLVDSSKRVLCCCTGVPLPTGSANRVGPDDDDGGGGGGGGGASEPPGRVGGLKLPRTLGLDAADFVNALSCACRDKFLGGGGDAADGDGGGGGSLGRITERDTEAHLCALGARITHLETLMEQTAKAVRNLSPIGALAGADDADADDGDTRWQKTTKRVLGALHQSGIVRRGLPTLSATGEPPPSKRQGLMPRSALMVKPALHVAPVLHERPAPSVVVGNSTVPVRRVGPRLLAPAPVQVGSHEEQLGHLITPDIYRSFCLYCDKAFSGISLHDGGAQLRLAVQHAAPGVSLGAAAELEIGACMRESREHVGLQSFGKLVRNLSALHQRRQSQESHASLAASSAAALGPEATLRATRAFRRADRDGSNDIDYRELRPLLREVGLDVSDDQVASMMRRFDVNEDSRIDLPEFLGLVKEVTQFRELVARSEEVFRRHDRDCNDLIDRTELRGALDDLGLDASSRDVREMLHRYDGDGNEQLDLHEFLALTQDVHRFREQLELSEQVFRAHDTDFSGYIELGELAAALRELGLDPTEKETSEILSRFDADKNAKLDKREFVDVVRTVERFHRAARRGKEGAAAPHSALEGAFRTFDTDANGTIDLSELQGALHHLGLAVDPQQAAAVLAKYDANGDGGLQLEEFRLLVDELKEFQAAAVGAAAPPPPPAAPAAPAATTAVADDVEAIFGRYDRQGRGEIELGELRVALGALGLDSSTADAEQVMARYDTSRDGALQLAEFRVLVAELRQFQLSTIESTFERFDRDHSGDIDVRELREALSSLGLKADVEHSAALMARHDVNGDGLLQLHEFRSLVTELRDFHERGEAERGEAVRSEAARAALERKEVRDRSPVAKAASRQRAQEQRAQENEERGRQSGSSSAFSGGGMQWGGGD